MDEVLLAFLGGALMGLLWLAVRPRQRYDPVRSAGVAYAGGKTYMERLNESLESMTIEERGQYTKDNPVYSTSYPAPMYDVAKGKYVLYYGPQGEMITCASSSTAHNRIL